MEPLITINELAEYLKVNRATIYYWIRNQQINYVKVGTRYRFRRSEVERFLRRDDRAYGTYQEPCRHCGRLRCRIDHSSTSEVAPDEVLPPGWD